MVHTLNVTLARAGMARHKSMATMFIHLHVVAPQMVLITLDSFRAPKKFECIRCGTAIELSLSICC